MTGEQFPGPSGCNGIPEIVEGAEPVELLDAAGPQILTATERGYGKRTPLRAFPRKGRGGKGVIAIKCSDRNGPLVAAIQIDDVDGLMLISDQGTLVRTRASEVAKVGRNTQGVTLMRMVDAEKLIGIVRVDKEEAPELDDDAPLASSDSAPPSNAADLSPGGEPTA